MSELAKALAKLQTNLPQITKTERAEVEMKGGGKYSYTYADLAKISAAVLPLLASLGLSFIAKPSVQDGRFVLAYSLLHESGEREDGEYPLPSSGSAQQIGSAITYGRRYCLCAVTGISPEDDDDGAAASPTTTTVHPRNDQQPMGPQVPADVADARLKVADAFQAVHGFFSTEAAGDHYRAWSEGGVLAQASAAELRKYAAYLAVSGDDGSTPSAGEPPVAPAPMSDRDRKAIFANLNKRGLTDADDQRAFMGSVLGRTVESRGDVTADEARVLLKHFKDNPLAKENQ